MTQKINNILHRVWFGSALPEKYRDNLLLLKQKNPAYRVWLHSDPDTMAKKEWKSLQQFCSKNDIFLFNIRKEKLVNGDLIQQELENSKKRTTVFEKRLCYVRASDIARLAIIYQYGGIYTDTDLRPINGFGNLFAAEGFLQTYYGKGEEGKTSKTLVYDLAYDFMAGIPGAEFYRIALAVIRANYNVLKISPAPERWLYVPDIHLMEDAIVALTGGATHHAYNYLLQQNKIKSTAATYLDTSLMYKPNADRAWQPPTHAATSIFSVVAESVQRDFDTFKAKAKETRFAQFPFQSFTKDEAYVTNAHSPYSITLV